MGAGPVGVRALLGPGGGVAGGGRGGGSHMSPLALVGAVFVVVLALLRTAVSPQETTSFLPSFFQRTIIRSHICIHVCVCMPSVRSNLAWKKVYCFFSAGQFYAVRCGAVLCCAVLCAVHFFAARAAPRRSTVGAF